MVKRALIFVHRWLGIALCLLFLLWFPSGIGMMYFPMPSVTPAARFERLPVLQASKVMLSPGEAAEKLGVDRRAISRSPPSTAGRRIAWEVVAAVTDQCSTPTPARSKARFRPRWCSASRRRGLVSL